jgi:hypothetical protein
MDALHLALGGIDIFEDTRDTVVIHPILAHRLMAWCSVEYEVDVYMNPMPVLSHPVDVNEIHSV